MTAASVTGTSSSSGGEEPQLQPPTYRRRRRRNHRRVLSSQEEEKTLIRRKTAHIETALLNCDRDRLAQLAVSPGGLLSDEVFILFQEPVPVLLKLLKLFQHFIKNKRE